MRRPDQRASELTMGKQVQTTALYRRLGRPCGLPTVFPTRPSYLQRLLSLFSAR